MDELLTKFGKTISVIEKAQKKTLPSSLSIREIATLAYPHAADKRDKIMAVMWEACVKGVLKGNNDRIEFIKRPRKTMEEESWAVLFSLSAYDRTLIHRDDFKRWLEDEGLWPPPPQSLLRAWYDSNPSKRRSFKASRDERIWAPVIELAKKIARENPELSIAEIAQTREIEDLLNKRQSEVCGRQKVYSPEYIARKLTGHRITDRSKKNNRIRS